MGIRWDSRAIAAGAVALIVLGATVSSTLAEEPTATPLRNPTAPKKRRNRHPTIVHGNQPQSSVATAATDMDAPSSSRTASPGSSDAGVVEMRSADGGTHVFKFSELDIEGRLKSPQLIYFLRRVRAEFAAGDLGHRPFLREMSETRDEPSF